MPQFRLTAKMAKELKVIELNPPNNCIRLYDDWYVDITRILRKTVFIFMHIQSRITLAIPNYEIGGTQNLLDSFPALLKHFLNQLCYHHIADKVYNFFTCSLEQMSFVKTNDKSTLRYICEFTNTLKFKAERSGYIDQSICNAVSEHWQNHFIKSNIDSTQYTTPLKLLKNLLGKPDE